MQVFAVLFLAAVALARPQTSYNNGAVTTVTERTFTIRGDGNAAADKYYSAGSSSGVSSYSNGASGVSSYSAAPAQQSYYQQYEAAAPAVAYQAASYQAAAPVYAYQAAAPAVAYQAAAYQAPAVAYQAAAPAYAYQAASYQAAAPAYAYQAAAPAYAYQSAAPTVAYQAASAAAYQAPAVAYQAVTAAPAVAYKAVAAAPAYKAAVSQRVESNYENNYNNNYESSVDQSQYGAGETKVFKHVYAFAAPEEPATRARISVQAPVSKRKHYKLVFIKAPSQQTIVDSDIVLPAQEEEKTLIYLLSKDRKQVQPEIRIKQAEASKHAKPEVFFLKYKNEQEAQSIASGAISGQTADVPANGEIISDGSVSILGQSAGQSGFSGSGFDSSFRSGAANSGASNVVYRGGFASGNSGFGSGNSGFAARTSGFGSGNSGFSSGTSGLRAASLVGNVSPATTYTSGRSSGFSFGSGSSGASFGSGSSGASFGSGSSGSAGLSGGFSAYSQDPASVALQASESFESSTAGSLSGSLAL